MPFYEKPKLKLANMPVMPPNETLSTSPSKRRMRKLSKSPDDSEDSKFMKYICLVTLTGQNAALALSMRYARTRPGDMFLASTAVLNAEVIKLTISLFMVYKEYGNKIQWLKALKTHVIDDPFDTFKVCVPSLVYVVQNNLLYIAASHLDAATYQVTYQLKILTTAVFAILILRKKLMPMQWGALLMLVVGVVLVQLARTDVDVDSKNSAEGQHRYIGFVAAMVACCLSGFAGIYFEKILKGSNISLWMRNVQLCLCSLPFAFLTCFINDRASVTEHGVFFGYDLFVWYLVFLQAAGGLIVAMVMKYADNILKGFATSLAIIVACVASVIFFDFNLTAQFSAGTFLVIISIFLYGWQPPPKQLPSTISVAKVDL